MEIGEGQIVPFFKEVARAAGGLPLSIYETTRAKKTLSIDQHRAVKDAVPNYLVELNAVLPVSIAAFYFGHISADFAWDSMLSGIVAGGRRWITDGVYRSIIFICGAFFLYLGLKFLVQGITLL